MNGRAMSAGAPKGDNYFYVLEERLIAVFSKVHEHASTKISFERTLRVPNDGNVYPLPAGLGLFPLRHLEDFETELPPAWADRGGVITPMHRAEAMWIGFGDGYPCAIKIGVGNINAINGERWTERLGGSECDYMVAPPQAALDGYCTSKDVVRQFVAVPLGQEEQLLSSSEHGGIRIVVYPMKGKRYDQLRAQWEQQGGADEDGGPGWGGMHAFAPGPRPLAVSLAAGGLMSSRVIADPYGPDAWDLSARICCFVTLIDAEQWSRITGAPTPKPPFTPADYEESGLPWFKYDADDLAPLDGAPELAAVKSPSSIGAGSGLQVMPAVDKVDPREVVELRLVRPPRRSRHPSPVVRSYWTMHRLFRRR
jgi:hypothetical protein